MIDAAEALADYRRRHPPLAAGPGDRFYRQLEPELIRCSVRPATAETWLQPHFYTAEARRILLEISDRYAAAMKAGLWQDRGDQDPVVVHARANRAGRIVWNGAHRLGAIILIDRPFTLPIRFCR